MHYKAFISYSHAADSQLAPTLQTALQRFARPFYRLRAINLFRDKTSLRLTPELWPLIQQALGASDFFILLASPDAAGSQWVQAEINEWFRLKQGSPYNFLIILTDGEIAWERAANDFDWAKTTALPLNLKGCFKEEPLYSDLRWAKKTTDLSLRNPQFLDDVGSLAATLHARPKDEMIGDDVRQHHLFKSVAAVVAILLFALAIAASGAAYYANVQRKEAQRQKTVAECQSQIALEAAENERLAREQEKQQREKAELATRQAEERRREADRQRNIAETQRQEAERQSERALARQLAAQAQLIIDHRVNNYERVPTGLLLAVESMRRYPTAEADVALRTGLDSLVGDEPSPLPLKNTDWAIAFSQNGHYIATAGPRDGGSVRVINLIDGGVVSLNHEATVSQLYFSQDGRKLTAIADNGAERVWDLPTKHEVPRDAHTAFNGLIAYSPNGLYLVNVSDGLTAHVFKAATKKEVAHFTDEKGISSIAFSPDGKHLMTGDYRHIQIWTVGSYQRGALIYSENGIKDFQFSPDGRYLGYLVTAWPGNKAAWLLELNTGHEVKCFPNENEVTAIAFGPPNTKYLFTASLNIIRRWEINSGREVGRIELDNRREAGNQQDDSETTQGNDTTVRALALSPEGKYLFIATSNEVKRKRWQADVLMEEACAYFRNNLPGRQGLSMDDWRLYLGNRLYRWTCADKARKAPPPDDPASSCRAYKNH